MEAGTKNLDSSSQDIIINNISSRTIGAINSNNNNYGNQLMEAINSSNILATSSRSLSSFLREVTSRVTRSGNSHSVLATAIRNSHPTEGIQHTEGSDPTERNQLMESGHPTERNQPMESNHPTAVTGSNNKVATADTTIDLRIEVSYDSDH